MLTDTHCHIHEQDFPIPATEVLQNASANNVRQMFCVGTSIQSSEDAVEFVKKYDKSVLASSKNNMEIPKQVQDDESIIQDDERLSFFAILGVHPHETKTFSDEDDKTLRDLIKNNREIIKGIGEIGLDYYYEFSPRKTQISVLEKQLQIAASHSLPISFHVRDSRENSGEVWTDFWSVINNFSNIRAVMHSFTDTRVNLGKALERGFYIGVNGIITFNKNPAQTEMYREIPLNRILLETDAPFLAPKPFRGQTNQPAYIKNIAEFLADFTDNSLEKIAEITTKNAGDLFLN
ncbi:MAG: TatD family hydrolase [Candidatus Nomurabacteria bacterium]|jgi:TatD DNase family protein|nr:TatD family hydrolase [Candidatus Nomurabacteria bacterium]